MKANTPEKLYISDSELNDAEHCVIWFKSQQNENDIEYTRTDVFIEKACDWLSDNLQTIVDVECPSAHHVESIPALGIITQTEFIEKFKKEIKYLFD